MVLIGVFFLLVGFLAMLTTSSYLVARELDDRVRRVSIVADAVAAELEALPGESPERLLRRQALATGRAGEVSIALVSLEASVAPRRGGAWSHANPPRALPTWIPPSFDGVVSEVDGGTLHLVARSVRTPVRGAWGIVVDIPFGPEVWDAIRDATGVRVDDPTLDDGRDRSSTGASSGETVPWFTFVGHTAWESGAGAFHNVETLVSPRVFFNRVFGGQTRLGEVSLGYTFLVILVGVGVLLLIIEGTALVMGFVLARSITGSVHELFEGTEHVRRGDLTHRIKVATHDQLGELAASFNAMTASVKNLLQEAAEKKRLEEELRIARQIQMSLLPKDATAIPGVTVSATCVPAREVGGDYYELIRLDDERLGVLVADVSGKGTSAAFYMAELKGLLLSLGRIHHSPRQLLVEVNRTIAPHIDSRSFITMIYAVVDLRDRTLTCARAGHTPLLFVRANGQPPTAESFTPSGLVVGLDGFQTQFEDLIVEETLNVQTGDVAVLFTDGISEAMNAESDLFGEDRLGQLVEAHAGRAPADIRAEVLAGVTAFVDGAEQHDDMTLVLLKIDDPEVGMRAGRA